MALSSREYDEILRAYDRKQAENRRIQSERKKEVYEKDPRLAEIDDKIASYAVSQAEKLLSGNENTLEEMRSEIEALSRKKRELLEALGYAEDYLKLPCDCPDCGDTGFVNGQRCHCFKKAEIDRIYQNSNLMKVLERENFSHFSLDYYSKDPGKQSEKGETPYDAAASAVDTCYRFIEGFGKEYQNLLFYGTTGVGKTFLSNCVAKALLDAGYSVVYFTAPELFDILEQDKFGKSLSARNITEHIGEADLLIIDDLGTEIANSFTSGQIFRILNERMLKEKSIIISTNLQIGELREHYSERSLSRILGSYTLVRLFGDDIRLRKKLK